MKKEVLSDIGLIGLGTMGAALARNFAGNEYKVSVFNRTHKVTDQYIKEFGSDFLVGHKTLASFVKSLKRPRKVIIIIKAGSAVDAVIGQLRKYLQKGDIVIDCGNSNFHDSIRRFDDLKKKGLHFIGCGVSGGEEGALKGPSMMPGGSRAAWTKIKKMFEAAAAKDFSGGPTVTYVGDNGAGHFVKMVHNGIEYGVMQMMAEAYDLLRTLYKLSPKEIAKIFADFQRGKLNSYLFEISIPVLTKKDEFRSGYLIDYIQDKAGQKGTGRWTAIDAIERGVTLSSITEAVYARVTSSKKDTRKELAKKYKRSIKRPTMTLKSFSNMLEDAMYAGMISSYAQGYDLIQTAAEEQKWDIDMGEISRIWEGGCIIRAKLLNFFRKAYGKTRGKNVHMFALKDIESAMKKSAPKLQELVSLAGKHGVPAPSLASALFYFESMTTENGPANLIQGLRDYFGAHTYERIDKKGSFHTTWT